MKDDRPETAAAFVKQAALKHGFTQAGIARVEALTEDARRLKAWLAAGYQGEMTYMSRHFELRTDPTLLVPGAKSVISLLYNYYSPEKQSDPDAPKISKYAYGEDYHHIIRRKLKALLREIRSEFGAINGRCFVDSGPVMEREWARRAGLGWTGKNTLLIHPKAGSYFFLSEIILDLELQPDQPIKDHCGTCTKCIEACPTDAIATDGYLLDASRCISYLTIELRSANVPSEFQEHMDNWAFGCDICQDVCPWNRFASQHTEPAFEPKEELLEMPAQQWYDITEEAFDRLFEKSAVKRTKYSGLRRNINFLKGE